MANSALNFFNRSYHKIPRKLTVHAKLTGAADVNANGYTINYGGDLVTTAAKNGEGVLDLTTNFQWAEMVDCQVTTNSASLIGRWTSATASTGIVKLTFSDITDATTNGAATDPDSAVIFVTLTFNLSNVGVR